MSHAYHTLRSHLGSREFASTCSASRHAHMALPSAAVKIHEFDGPATRGPKEHRRTESCPPERVNKSDREEGLKNNPRKVDVEVRIREGCERRRRLGYVDSRTLTWEIRTTIPSCSVAGAILHEAPFCASGITRSRSSSYLGKWPVPTD